MSIDSNNTRATAPMRTLHGLVLACILFPLLGGWNPAQAGVITVGKSGTTGNCTKPTLAEALEWASELGGYNVIWLTNDVEGGVWRNQHVEIPSDAIDVDIVGGFADCNATVPSGRSTLLGDGGNRPVLRIRGGGRVNLRALDIGEGSTDDADGAGIDYQGHGVLTLTDVGIHGHQATYWEWPAFRFDGSGGRAYLHLLGDVEVTDNQGTGMIVRGNAEVTARGEGNRMVRNGGVGMWVHSPAQAQIGGEGDMFADNGGSGFALKSYDGDGDGLVSRLYSTDPHNPLRLARNHSGIWMDWGAGSTVLLCTRNVQVVDNNGAAFRVSGRNAHLAFNGNCSFPAEADIACGDDVVPCNLVADNSSSPGPVVNAWRYGTISFERTLFTGNTGTSLLSTNLGEPASTASITLTDSVVAFNALRDNLFEALNGGILDIWDSTVKNNVGMFQVSFVGTDPSLLQMTNSIIDQPQQLLVLEGSDGSTTRFTHVLAQNVAGAPAGGDILVGRPTFIGETAHLAPGSLGIDYAPAGGGTDFAGRPRDVDAIDVPDQHGPRDLGAFESQQREFPLFANGFD